MSPMSRNFVARLESFVARHGIPLVQFRKGERKDAVMAEHLRKFHRTEGVVFVGKAQEKTAVFRTEKRRSPITGLPYPWIVRSTPNPTPGIGRRTPRYRRRRNPAHARLRQCRRATRQMDRPCPPRRIKLDTFT
jgi:hypothetical protein